MKHKRHNVTDHAVLRYLERVEGIDVAALRAEISQTVEGALERATQAGLADGANGVVASGFVYRLAGGAVVTVARHKMPDKRFGHGRAHGGGNGE